MKLRTFFLIYFIPFILISLISYFTSYININKDDTLSDSGPRSAAGKTISRKFVWDLRPDRTIITELELPLKEIKKEMKNFGINLKIKHPSYISKQGFFRTKEGLVLNYKSIFENSIPIFKKISPYITYSAGLNGGKDPIVCFLKFVQAIKYKIPPKFMNGKYIMEFLPPLNCLFLKYGDCDSKSVLLAELLEGDSYKKEKMAIVILRGFGIFHAILAIERTPMPGMLSFYINREGPYIPIETTDKGWMPGFSNKQVLLCLQNGKFRFVKLF